MSYQESQTLGAVSEEELPLAPSLPILILWGIGIGLATFTFALLAWFATMSRPDRLEETLVLVSAALLLEVIVARRWFGTLDD